MTLEIAIVIALFTSLVTTSVVFYTVTRKDRKLNKARMELEQTMRRHPAGKKFLTEEEVIFND